MNANINYYQSKESRTAMKITTINQILVMIDAIHNRILLVHILPRLFSINLIYILNLALIVIHLFIRYHLQIILIILQGLLYLIQLFCLLYFSLNISVFFLFKFYLFIILLILILHQSILNLMKDPLLRPIMVFNYLSDSFYYFYKYDFLII